jgi:chromosome segregation ATPase
MAQDLKITSIVDQKVIDQVKALGEAFESAKEKYSALALKLAEQVTIKVTGYTELKEKAKGGNAILKELYETETKIAKLQKELNAILVESGKSLQKLSNASNVVSMFNKLTESLDRASSALEKITQTSSSASQSQQQVAQATQSASAAIGEAAKNVGIAGGEYDRILSSVKSYNAEVQKLNNTLISNTRGLSSIRQELRNLDRDYNNGIVTEQKYIEQKTKLLQTERELSAQNQAYSNRLKNHAMVAISITGSYNEMNASLLVLEKRFKDLSEADRNSEFGVNLLKDIDKLKNQLKSIDAQMGNYQRNVGNYASHWNGLQVSVQQIGRELPSLAIGWNTFFLAISNNLPILADEIKKAKIQYEEFKKAGISSIPVWKQVVSSIFSWQTALVLAITVLSMYGKDIIEWVGNIFNAESATIRLTRAELDLAEARRKGISDSAKEIAQLEILYKKLSDAALSRKELATLGSQWIKTFPEYSNVLTQEGVNINALNIAYKNLKEQIVATAQARAISEKIMENEKLRLEYQSKYNSLLTDNYQRRKEILEKEKRVENPEDLTKSEKRRIEILNDEIKETNKELNKYAKGIDAIDRKNKELTSSLDISRLFNAPEEGTFDFWQQQKTSADIALKSIRSDIKKTLDASSKAEDDYDTMLKKVFAIRGKMSEDEARGIVDSYLKANNDMKKADEELMVYQTKTIKQITKEREKYADYIKKIDNLLAMARAKTIDAERISEIEQVKAKYQERASIIKGESEKELELRKTYAQLEAKEIEYINLKYDTQLEQSRLKRDLEIIEGNSQQELDLRLEKQLQLNEVLREVAISEARKRGEDEAQVNELYDKKFKDILKSNVQDRIKLLSQENEMQLSQLEINNQQRLNALEKAYKRGEINEKEYQQGLYNIQRDAVKLRLELMLAEAQAELVAAQGVLPEAEIKKIQIRIDNLRAQLEAVSLANPEDGEKTKQWSEGFISALRNMQEVADETMGGWADVFSVFNETLSKMVSSADSSTTSIVDMFKKMWNQMSSEDRAKLILDSFSNISKGVSEIMSNMYDSRIERIEEEQEALQESHDKEIEQIENLETLGAISAEEAEARKRAAEERTARKEKELEKQKAQMQEKSAKWEKANSIVQSIIATSLAVTKALPNFVLAAIVGVMGAAQTAIIAAQPIPKYAKGTDNHPGGLAIVGDGGRREGILTNKGLFATPSIPTLVDLPKDAAVVPDLEQYISVRPLLRSDLGAMAQDAEREGIPFTVNVDTGALELRKEIRILTDEVRKLSKARRKEAVQRELDYLHRTI